MKFINYMNVIGIAIKLLNILYIRNRYFLSNEFKNIQLIMKNEKKTSKIVYSHHSDIGNIVFYRQQSTKSQYYKQKSVTP